MRLALVILTAAIGSCVERSSFQCAGSEQCTLGGTEGLCTGAGFCAFPDSSCGSGFRYGSDAPGDLSASCTMAAPDAGADGPGPNLVDFAPSNFGPERLTAGMDAFQCSGSDADVEIHTDLGLITRVSDSTNLRPSGIAFEVIPQPGNPGIGVFSVRGFIVEAGCTLRVVGIAALAIAVNGHVTISGTIDAGGGHGDPDVAGPGGFAGGSIAVASGAGSGPGGGLAATTEDVGGGGAGHRAAGGTGGSRDAVLGGSGGGEYGVVALSPLVGGSGGSSGGGGVTAGLGGGGGGAVQISARGTITITVGGVITAGGAGANGGGDEDGGGGGGSGGSILLEADVVELKGTLAVNGGGGGAGANEVTPGAPGGDGRPDAIRASGGATSGEGKFGGPGGAGATPEGGNGGSTAGIGGDDNAGGGGGAGGRMLLRANVIMRPGVTSPTAGLSEVSPL